MKSKRTFPLLVILILAAIVATHSTFAAITPDNGPSASGAGLFRFPDPTGRIETWSFSFEAIANKNGQTRGRAQFDNLTSQRHIVVKINCLSVTAGINSAFASMGGKVLHSDDPNLPKSENVIFAASDGPFFFSSDTMTPPFPFPFADHDCHDTQPLTVLPVENGDIEIQL